MVCNSILDETINILLDINKGDNVNNKFKQYCELMQQTIRKVKETKRQTELALIDEKEVEVEYLCYLETGRGEWDKVEEFNMEGLGKGVHILTENETLSEYVKEVDKNLPQNEKDQLIAIYKKLETHKADKTLSKKDQLKIDIVREIIFRNLHNKFLAVCSNQSK